MSFHPSIYGQIELPDLADARRPNGRPDGVRVVRRPQTKPPEARR